MAVIGWLVVVAFAAYLWFVALGGAYMELGFTGKISWWFPVVAAVASGVSYFAWINCPFQLMLVG